MRILVIPHVLQHPVRVRAFELAGALAGRGHEVTLVTGEPRPASRALTGRLRHRLRTLRGGASRVAERLEHVRIPAWYSPSATAAAFNRASFRRYLRNHRFDVIINSAYRPEWSVDPVPPGTVYIVDIVDDHEEGFRRYGDARMASLIARFYPSEIGRAHRAVAVSDRIRRLVSDRYGSGSPVDCTVIGNGAQIDWCRNAEPSKVSVLRESLRLGDSFVFGYIGGMDEFIDVGLVLEAFQRVRARHPRAALVWVGGGSRHLELAARRQELESEGVRIVGAVPPAESRDWISLFDVGLIPKRVDPFTDAMMPIKSVEYGAARIPVLSSEFSELKRIAFPNVKLLPMREDDWAEAMIGAVERPVEWDPSWDGVFDDYDWDRLAEGFERVAAGCWAR